MDYDQRQKDLDSAVGRLGVIMGQPILPRQGPAAQRLMALRLYDAGFNVIVEQPVLGLGRDGWLDIYAVKNGFRVAIEIDRGRPKKSSLEKLGFIHAEMKIACYMLDRPMFHPIPPGVRTLLLPSRIPTSAERSYKGFGPYPRKFEPEWAARLRVQAAADEIGGAL